MGTIAVGEKATESIVPHNRGMPITVKTGRRRVALIAAIGSSLGLFETNGTAPTTWTPSRYCGRHLIP